LPELVRGDFATSAGTGQVAQYGGFPTMMRAVDGRPQNRESGKP
jgi:hypothetical protein